LAQGVKARFSPFDDPLIIARPKDDTVRSVIAKSRFLFFCLLAAAFLHPANAQPPDLMERLPPKIHRLQAELPAWMQRTGNSEVPALMQKLKAQIDAKDFEDAEKTADSILKIMGASEPAPTPQPVTVPVAAGAKPLACPAPAAPIELAEGTWTLSSDCAVSGLKLTGSAHLWSESRAFTVAGNIELRGNAGLHIHGGTFTVANRFKLQYNIDASGNALLDIRDASVSTNAGVTANLTSNYSGSGESLLHIENVKLDNFTSWLLANLRDRARLETKDSAHFPSEIYPSGDATVRIEGPRSGHAVWLKFKQGASAVLDGLPEARPFTFSFGRNTPGVQGVGYQIDVVNGKADFPVTSFAGSKVTIKNSRTGVGYEFTDVTSPETLTGMKGGTQSGTYRNQGRVLELANATLPPFGWQLYSSNESIAPDKVLPVKITNSLINEMGAAFRGAFDAEHVQFAFAAIAAFGPGSKVHVRDSVINSHTVMGNNDGVVTIEDSEIFGSRIQAIAHSRIVILNSALRANEPNPKCIPVLPALDGKPQTRCNPYNPEREVDFVTQGEGVIEVAGIDPILAPIRSGDKYTFAGDVIVKSLPEARFTYNLSYRRATAPEFTSIVTGATGPKRSQPLGQLDTTALLTGDYIVQLQLLTPTQEPIAVERPFSVAAPR
jgi:hypothetical protein